MLNLECVADSVQSRCRVFWASSVISFVCRANGSCGSEAPQHPQRTQCVHILAELELPPLPRCIDCVHTTCRPQDLCTLHRSRRGRPKGVCSTLFCTFLFSCDAVLHRLSRSSVKCCQRCRVCALIFQCIACIDFQMRRGWM